jgi:hypothetical protein
MPPALSSAYRSSLYGSIASNLLIAAEKQAILLFVLQYTDFFLSAI